MLQQLIFTTVALACFATGVHADDWQDVVKQSIDATHHSDAVLGTDATPVPSDLTLDPAFGDNGLRTFWPPANSTYTAREHVLRESPPKRSPVPTMATRIFCEKVRALKQAAP